MVAGRAVPACESHSPPPGVCLPGGVPARGMSVMSITAVLAISGICTQQLCRIWLLPSGCFAGETEAKATSSHRALRDGLEAERSWVKKSFPPTQTV